MITRIEHLEVERFLKGDVATGFETDGNRALVPLRPGLGVQLT
jgi:hypothetical protein